jgi:hypothetical protein
LHGRSYLLLTAQAAPQSVKGRQPGNYSQKYLPLKENGGVNFLEIHLPSKMEK